MVSVSELIAALRKEIRDNLLEKLSAPLNQIVESSLAVEDALEQIDDKTTLVSEAYPHNHQIQQSVEQIKILLQQKITTEVQIIAWVDENTFRIPSYKRAQLLKEMLRLEKEINIDDQTKFPILSLLNKGAHEYFQDEAEYQQMLKVFNTQIEEEKQ